jgi:hypothetical protein
MASSRWTPVHEPIGRTLARNVAIALLVGAGLAAARQQLRLIVPFSLLALWFSLGGHYVEVLFLNSIRPRIPAAGAVQRSARILVWYAGGSVLSLLMLATARAMRIRGPGAGRWWLGGLLLIGIELVVHVLLALRRSANFYDGRG